MAGILKHVEVLITWADDSVSNLKFTSTTKAAEYVANIDFLETTDVYIKPVYARLGETVSLTVVRN